MKNPSMRAAEDELEAGFAETVEAERHSQASLKRIRDRILVVFGGADAARREVERTRASEAEDATGEPPPLP